MMQHDEVSIFWFRRDLRLDDNIGLKHALIQGSSVVPLFIFDPEILENLPKNDARISFIYSTLKSLDLQLKNNGSSLLVQKGNVLDVWKKIISKYKVKNVYFNKDYEPYAIKRDKAVVDFLSSQNIRTYTFKDQVIFEENEILKSDGNPYIMYTPYKNKWLNSLDLKDVNDNLQVHYALNNFLKFEVLFPSLKAIGFVKSKQKVRPYYLNHIAEYHLNRDYPSLDATTSISPHLRFGTVSIRKLVLQINSKSSTYLNELIWREFFMQILFHFPEVVTNNYKSKYDRIVWRNNKDDFKKWCEGTTGYPMVDAGMRELNNTGYMHNRVRMITAGFLCKHLLIDWRWGEAYFAEKLLDYELSSNNGNWQWAAGTGCDAAPYFRIFNPITQLTKFDKQLIYVHKWIPELDTGSYPEPMIDHAIARERCLQVYKTALQ